MKLDSLSNCARGASEEEACQRVFEELNAPDLLRRELQHVESRAPRNNVTPGTQGKDNLFADLAQDLRYSLRTLLKNPGFTIVAVTALALGIGANSAIFSVANAVLLRPLPFKNPEQLVMVWANATHLGFPNNTPAPPNFLDWQKQNTVFTGMAAMAERSFNLTGVGEPERLDGRRVSANLFDVLGVPPLLGRTFVPDDDRPGVHVVLLSYSLWQRRFGSDPNIIGRAVTLNGQSYTMIGVMPRGVRLPGYGNWNDQLWVPIAFTNEEITERGTHFLDVIARIKSGITLKQAQAEMETIAARLAKEYPKYNTRIGATVTPLHEEIVGDIKPVLLALLGGGFGLLLAFAGTRVLKTFVPATVLQAQTINIDAKVVVFTALIALVTGIVFGLAPAMHASHSNLNESLKEGGRDSAAGRKGNRLRGLLVIGEVAVSFILLIGAGLLINSFLHLRNLDLGFRTDHLLTMKVDLSELKYPDGERRSLFFEEVLRRIRVLPGVQSAAVAGNLPFTYNGDSATIAVEGIPDPPPDQWLDVIYRAIGPGYFSTMGIPIARGRDFTDQDKGDSKKVVVISEKTAQHYWPGQDPIGKRLKPGATNSDVPWREVIGVVKDVRQNDFIAQPKMQMYFSYRQMKDLAANALVVRTSVEPMSLATSVRNAVLAVDKDQPVADIDTMDHIVSQAIARQRFSMLLLGIFAALALVLAAVGIYGVMSYSVAQRTHEIGIRIALGAQRGDVVGMTMKQGLKLVGVGLLIGLASAFVLTRVMASLLFGISPTDPATFASICVVLLGVAALASYIPALRATKVDPMVALQAQ